MRELAPLLFDKEDSVKADDYHSVLNWRKLVFVIHPNSRFLGIWSVMNRSIGVYLFMDVPFRIAFHAFGCFNAW